MSKKPNRFYNFGAGPAMLPDEVLLEAREELLDWQGLGASVMEWSVRTPEYEQLMQQAERDLRELLDIPPRYQVLFLSGAARTQFAMIPMNLLKEQEKAGYLISGIWSDFAYQEARRLYPATYCIANSVEPQVAAEAHEFYSTPLPETWKFQEETKYVYYTPNETINGVRFMAPPQVGERPLVADMTSCLLSEPVNVRDFALIFAGAQKNIAPAGLTLVIIREDLLEQACDVIPLMLDYRIHAQYHSMYATPPTLNCYFAAKMFRWLKKQGGINAIYQMNQQKANRLYDYIDRSSFYHCRVKKQARSLVNVCFRLNRPELEAKFIQSARQHGLLALKGHRFVGGIRASLYNAMPISGVEALLEFMREFAENKAFH